MNKKSGSSKVKNSAARLMAVQAVYQMLKTGETAESVSEEYLNFRAGMEIEGEEMIRPNTELFQFLTMGVSKEKEELLKLIETHNHRATATKEPLLQAVLLCGGYELKNPQGIDFAIIISDYLHVAEAFFEGGEKALINGILDAIRKDVFS